MKKNVYPERERESRTYTQTQPPKIYVWSARACVCSLDRLYSFAPLQQRTKKHEWAKLTNYLSSFVCLYVVVVLNLVQSSDSLSLVNHDNTHTRNKSMLAKTLFSFWPIFLYFFCGFFFFFFFCSYFLWKLLSHKLWLLFATQLSTVAITHIFFRIFHHSPMQRICRNFFISFLLVLFLFYLTFFSFFAILFDRTLTLFIFTVRLEVSARRTTMQQ